jgi:hypothetical protein
MVSNCIELSLKLSLKLLVADRRKGLSPMPVTRRRPALAAKVSWLYTVQCLSVFDVVSRFELNSYELVAISV